MTRQLNYKRLLCVLLSLLLVVVIFIAGGCSTSDEQYIDSGNEDEVSVSVESVTDNTEDSGNSVITEIKSNGISLARAVIPREAYVENNISAQADSAYTITATVSPETAINKEVDWSVAWKDSSNKVVTDYVTVVATSDGALTANVTCLQAFSVQIIVTCTSRDNPNTAASCTVDYIKRCSDPYLQIYCHSTATYILSSNSDMPFFPCNSTVTIRYMQHSSPGTLNGTLKGGQITTTLDDELMNAMKAASRNLSVTLNQESLDFINLDLTSTNKVKVEVKDSLSFVTFNGTGSIESRERAWKELFYSYVSTYPNKPHATISMPYSYSYPGYSQVTTDGIVSFQICFDLSTLEAVEL